MEITCFSTSTKKIGNLSEGHKIANVSYLYH
jgi:hypothetical protein